MVEIQYTVKGDPPSKSFMEWNKKVKTKTVCGKTGKIEYDNTLGKCHNDKNVSLTLLT